jgi:hypothetical protein
MRFVTHHAPLVAAENLNTLYHHSTSTQKQLTVTINNCQSNEQKMEKEETTRDIIKNLEVLNRSWCCHYDNVADPTADDRKTAEVTTTTTTTTTTTPLDAAIQMLSKSSISTVQNVVPFLLSLIEKTFSTKSAAAATTTTTTTTNEDVDPKVYKLKQIEWHVALMLDLWSQCYPQNENDDAFVKIFVTVQQQQQQQQQKQRTTKKENSTDKRKKKKKRSKNENVVSTHDNRPVDPKQQRTVLLDHLVEILSKAPYLLPIEIPIKDFITKRCLKEEKYWKKLPNVVTYICDTFEMLNPYVEDDENDGSTTGLSNLSEGRFSFVDDTKATSTRKQVVDPKKLQQQRKRGRDEKEALQKKQQQQQKKKQRLLASLKQNRFQTTKNRMTTHFNSNINDISKLLDSTKRMNTTSKTGKNNDNIQNNDGRKTGGTTTNQQQQQQQPLKRKASTLDEVKTNNQQSNTQKKHNTVATTDPSLKPPSTKATATAAEETPVKSRHKTLSSSSQHVSWSGQSNNDLDNDALMTTTTSTTPNDVTIGTTAASSNNGIAANLHLPDKTMLNPNAAAGGGGGGGGVVEETPAFTRSRSLVEETPTPTTRGSGSNDAAKSSFLDSLDLVSQNHHNHDDDDDEGRMAPPAHKATTTTTSGTAPVQPTKLFGVLKSQNKRSGNNKINNNHNRRATFGQSNAKGGNSTNNNKPAPKSAVQIARALLRRRSM